MSSSSGSNFEQCVKLHATHAILLSDYRQDLLHYHFHNPSHSFQKIHLDESSFTAGPVSFQAIRDRL